MQTDSFHLINDGDIQTPWSWHYIAEYGNNPDLIYDSNLRVYDGSTAEYVSGKPKDEYLQQLLLPGFTANNYIIFRRMGIHVIE